MFAGYQLDDGHGDYNRSYEQNWDIDYADYSTDHRENNYRNYERKVHKIKKKRIKITLTHYKCKRCYDFPYKILYSFFFLHFFQLTFSFCV